MAQYAGWRPETQAPLPLPADEKLAIAPSSRISPFIMNGTSPLSVRIAKRPAPNQASVKRLAQHYGEFELRNRIKNTGGQWDANARLWRLPRNKVKALGPLRRTVKETGASHA